MLHTITRRSGGRLLLFAGVNLLAPSLACALDPFSAVDITTILVGIVLMAVAL